MQNQNIVKIVLFLATFSCIHIPYTWTTNEREIAHRAEAIIDDSSFDESLFGDDLLFEAVHQHGHAPKRSNPQDIINLLLEVDAIDILDQDLYLKTNGLNIRPLLDLPIFEIHDCCTPSTIFSSCGQPCNEWSAWHISAPLFFNKTDRSNFTRHSTNLSSYLALAQPTLIERLQNTIDQLKDLFENDQFDIAKIFSLFKCMTVEERRVGFMFNMLYYFQQSEVRLLLPFYYLEKNFFLNNDQIKAVEAEFGAGDPKEQEKFQREHFISDKIGFGDTRLEWARVVFERPFYELRLGVFTTFPTARTIRAGLYGSSFPRPASLPLLDIEHLFDLAQNPTPEAQKEALDEISTYVLGALDRLSANLLDSPLGNGGHMTLGALLRTSSCLYYFLKKSWAERITLYTRISLEYLFPHFENRFYIARNNFSQFEQRNFENPQQAEENLIFIETELSKKLYLLGLDTRIQPGPIFRWTSHGCYRHNRWEISFGTDMWLQFKEIRHRINTFDLIRPAFDSAAARQPFAYQSKLFGGVSYRLNRPTHDLLIGILIDSTYSTSGIGADYTGALAVQASF